VNAQQQIQRGRDVEALTKLWVNGMPGVPLPPARQWDIWFQIHRNFGTIVYGLEKCSLLYLQRRGVLETDHAIRHASRVMNDRAKDLARRYKKPDEHFPMNRLTPDLAESLGLPSSMVGMALSADMFWRLHRQLQAQRDSGVPKPTPRTGLRDM
jgi:hypothetical protein